MDMNYALAVPEIVLACLAMALLMAGVFGLERGRTVSWLSVVSLAVTLLLVLAGGTDRVVGLGGLFATGAFAVYVKVLVLLGSMFAIVMSLTFNERESLDRFEFPIVILFATLGMLMMVSANDLIALYLGLELQSLSLYVLAAFRRDTLRSSEAGLKYFVLGALSSGMLLYGCSMIYGFVGATGFDAIAAAVGNGGEPSLGLVVGLVFLLAGLCFKVSAAPFHMWTPDVYEGAPTPVTALFSVAPKIAALASVRPCADGTVRRYGRQVATDHRRSCYSFHGHRRLYRDCARKHQAADGVFVHRACRLRACRRSNGH